MTPAPGRVLVVDDDPGVLRVLVRMLVDAGYAVDTASGAADGERRALAAPYDALVLDLDLPDGNGIDVLRALRRARCDVPVVILTGRGGAPADVVRGLDAGADDYITKPVDEDVLRARVRAAIRRGAGASVDRVTYGALTIDRIAHEAHVGGEVLALTPKEFGLLECLLLRADTPVQRAELLEYVWKMDFDPGTKLLDVHISRLRAKLRAVTDSPGIKAVRGTGFMLSA